MNFELLAEERLALDSSGLSSAKWDWSAHALHLRRGIKSNGDFAKVRSEFLIAHALDLTGITREDALNDPRKARGSARSLPCRIGELKHAGLWHPPCNIDALPPFSASVRLKFRLASPILARDDEPFHLFDNPVRKDHTFGVPCLPASTLKGLAADAFQRGFPVETNTASDADTARRRFEFRRLQESALRLFGIASDDPEALDSQSGRLRFQTTWFSHIQYLVMNPTKQDGTGLGSMPIHFEAIAPVDERGRPVEAEASMVYFNPGTDGEQEEAVARADLACLVAAVAAWWPTLGLGAKRLAGYGAIVPTSASVDANGYDSKSFDGEDSWMRLAYHIAGEMP